MRRKLLYFILFAATAIPTISLAQTWQWGVSGYAAEGLSCAIDVSGNIYGLGYVWNTEIVGGDTIDKSGSLNELSVSKYDGSGNLLWVRSVENGLSMAVAIETDPYSNVYVLGNYFDTISFGTYTLINPDTTSAILKYFIAKLNADGTVIWAKDLGNVSSNDTLQDNGDNGDIAIDQYGNILVTCSFANNPVIGSFSFANHDTSLMTTDIFFAKLDSSGNVIWATTYGGVDNELPEGLCVSPAQNIYLTGDFSSDTIYIGSYAVVNGDSTANRPAIFLAKMDSTGMPLWTSETSGSFITQGVMAMAADNNDCAYITGYFSDGPFNLGRFSLPSASPSSQNGFLAKFKSSGAVLWVKGFYGAEIEPWSLAIDNCTNSVWVAGKVTPGLLNTIDGRDLLTPPGVTDPVFIAGWRADSSFISIASLMSGGEDWMGITCNDAGGVYVCSDIWIDSLVVGPDTLNCPNLDSFGEYFLLAKYSSGDSCTTAGVATVPANHSPGIAVYPNPASDFCTIQIDGIADPIGVFSIYDVTGRVVSSAQLSGINTVFSTMCYPPGVYWLKIDLQNSDPVMKKLVVW